MRRQPSRMPLEHTCWGHGRPWLGEGLLSGSRAERNTFTAACRPCHGVRSTHCSRASVHSMPRTTAACCGCHAAIPPLPQTSRACMETSAGTAVCKPHSCTFRHTAASATKRPNIHTRAAVAAAAKAPSNHAAASTVEVAAGLPLPDTPIELELVAPASVVLAEEPSPSVTVAVDDTSGRSRNVHGIDMQSRNSSSSSRDTKRGSSRGRWLDPANPANGQAVSEPSPPLNPGSTSSRSMAVSGHTMEFPGGFLVDTASVPEWPSQSPAVAQPRGRAASQIALLPHQTKVLQGANHRANQAHDASSSSATPFPSSTHPRKTAVHMPLDKMASSGPKDRMPKTVLHPAGPPLDAYLAAAPNVKHLEDLVVKYLSGTAAQAPPARHARSLAVAFQHLAVLTGALARRQGTAAAGRAALSGPRQEGTQDLEAARQLLTLQLQLSLPHMVQHQFSVSAVCNMLRAVHACDVHLEPAWLEAMLGLLAERLPHASVGSGRACSSGSVEPAGKGAAAAAQQEAETASTAQVGASGSAAAPTSGVKSIGSSISGGTFCALLQALSHLNTQGALPPGILEQHLDLEGSCCHLAPAMSPRQLCVALSCLMGLGLPLHPQGSCMQALASCLLPLVPELDAASATQVLAALGRLQRRWLARGWSIHEQGPQQQQQQQQQQEGKGQQRQKFAQQQNQHEEIDSSGSSTNPPSAAAAPGAEVSPAAKRAPPATPRPETAATADDRSSTVPPNRTGSTLPGLDAVPGRAWAWPDLDLGGDDDDDEDDVPNRWPMEAAGNALVASMAALQQQLRALPSLGRPALLPAAAAPVETAVGYRSGSQVETAVGYWSHSQGVDVRERREAGAALLLVPQLLQRLSFFLPDGDVGPEASGLSAAKSSTGRTAPGSTRSSTGPASSSSKGMDAAQLSSCVWACAHLRVAPSATWLKSFMMATAGSMQEFQPGQLAAMLWALAKLKWQPAPAWLDKVYCTMMEPQRRGHRQQQHAAKQQQQQQQGILDGRPVGKARQQGGAQSRWHHSQLLTSKRQQRRQQGSLQLRADQQQQQQADAVPWMCSFPTEDLTLCVWAAVRFRNTPPAAWTSLCYKVLADRLHIKQYESRSLPILANSLSHLGELLPNRLSALLANALLRRVQRQRKQLVAGTQQQQQQQQSVAAGSLPAEQQQQQQQQGMAASSLPEEEEEDRQQQQQQQFEHAAQSCQLLGESGSSSSSGDASKQPTMHHRVNSYPSSEDMINWNLATELSAVMWAVQRLELAVRCPQLVPALLELSKLSMQQSTVAELSAFLLPASQVPAWNLHGPAWLDAFYRHSLPGLPLIGSLRSQRAAAGLLLGLAQAGATVPQHWLQAYWQATQTPVLLYSRSCIVQLSMALNSLGLVPPAPWLEAFTDRAEAVGGELDVWEKAVVMKAVHRLKGLYQKPAKAAAPATARRRPPADVQQGTGPTVPVLTAAGRAGKRKGGKKAAAGRRLRTFAAK